MGEKVGGPAGDLTVAVAVPVPVSDTGRCRRSRKRQLYMLQLYKMHCPKRSNHKNAGGRQRLLPFIYLT